MNTNLGGRLALIVVALFIIETLAAVLAYGANLQFTDDRAFEHLPFGRKLLRLFFSPVMFYQGSRRYEAGNGMSLLRRMTSVPHARKSFEIDALHPQSRRRYMAVTMLLGGLNLWITVGVGAFVFCVYSFAQMVKIIVFGVIDAIDHPYPPFSADLMKK
jgi:hypothetical protein